MTLSSNLPDTPQMKNGQAPLDKFKPYALNPRTHPREQIELLAKILKLRGPDQPIVVDEKWEVLKGHGRLEAAQLAGLTSFPYVQRFDLSDNEKMAVRIEDNQIALLSGWDPELLRVELGKLSMQGYEMGMLGFPDVQLAAFMVSPTSGATDPDDAPEPPVNPVAIRGDLWILGRHRLICGDSTNAKDVAKVLGSVKPHLMVTDPPYGIEYDAGWRRTARNADGSLLSTGRGRAIGAVANDDRADWREAWALFPGDVVYVWHAGRHASAIQASIEAVAFEIRCQVIWAKQQFAIGRGDYHWQHEPCWYAVRKGKAGHWAGDRKQTTLWNIPKPQKSETGHSTQKPVECMKRPIENNSSPGQAVYEPFSGSGTTIIAAEMTGRACYAIEINPAYVDVAIERWQAFAKAEAVLDGNGRTFAEISHMRKKSSRLAQKARGKAGKRGGGKVAGRSEKRTTRALAEP